MTRYSIVIHERRNVRVEVEAESPDDAWDKAKAAVAAGQGKKGAWDRTPVITRQF